MIIPEITHPTVAQIDPKTPLTLIPINVDKFTASGTGVIWDIVIILLNVSWEIQPNFSTICVWIKGIIA